MAILFLRNSLLVNDTGSTVNEYISWRPLKALSTWKNVWIVLFKHDGRHWYFSLLALICTKINCIATVVHIVRCILFRHLCSFMCAIRKNEHYVRYKWLSIYRTCQYYVHVILTFHSISRTNVWTLKCITQFQMRTRTCILLKNSMVIIQFTTSQQLNE